MAAAPNDEAGATGADATHADVDDSLAEGPEDTEGEMSPLDAFSGGEPALDAFNQIDSEGAPNEQEPLMREEGPSSDDEGTLATDGTSSEDKDDLVDKDAPTDSEDAPLENRRAPSATGREGSDVDGPTSSYAGDTPPTGEDIVVDGGASSVGEETEEPSDLQHRHGAGSNQGHDVDYAPADRVEMFFQQGPQIMGQLNPHRSFANCPATAAAVDHFLRTGEVIPAESGGPRDEFGYDERFSPVTDLQRLLAKPGAFATLRAIGNERYGGLQGAPLKHYFVVVNRAGTLWVLDAYNHSTMDYNSFRLHMYQFQSLDYYHGPFSVRRVPAR
jgi:hypothetical protein